MYTALFLNMAYTKTLFRCYTADYKDFPSNVMQLQLMWLRILTYTDKIYVQIFRVHSCFITLQISLHPLQLGGQFDL